MPDWLLKIGTFFFVFLGVMIVTMFLIFWVLPICFILATGAWSLATG